jgi:hypothetical protein
MEVNNESGATREDKSDGDFIVPFKGMGYRSLSVQGISRHL